MLGADFYKNISYKKTCIILCTLLTLFGMLVMLLGSALIHIASAPEQTTALTVAGLPQGFVVSSRDFLKMINTIRTRSDLVSDTDMRIYAHGYSEQWQPYVASDQNHLVGMASSAVFAARLVEAEQLQSDSIYLKYRYVWEIEQIVVMHEIYEQIGVGDRVEMTLSVSSGFDISWLETGKSYLIHGALQRAESEQTEYRLQANFSGMDHWSYKIEDQDGKHCLYDDQSSSYLPIISELCMPVEAFLKTDMGCLWQERVISEVENRLSASLVVGTGILESIRAFNLDETVIVEGKAFTAQQQEKGEAVCMVSEELARQNGLSVGDSFLWQLQGVASSPYPDSEGGLFVNKLAFSAEREMRVVGIYRNTETYVNEDRGIHPNTVFVPLKLVTPSVTPQSYSAPQISFVLDAGDENAFELEMKELGYGNVFEYHSGPKLLDTQTLAQLKLARTQLIADAGSLAKSLYLFGALLIAGASFWIMRRSRQEIGRLYRIETAESVLFGHLFFQMLAVCILSTAVSMGVAVNTLVPLARSVLHRLADADWADMILARLPETFPFGTGWLIGIAWSLLCSVIFAAIGMKQGYYYEYREEDET